MTPENILIADLEKGVKLRLPSAVHKYLAMQTDFDVRAWEQSPANFDDKWRLAIRIMEGTVRDKDIIFVLNGGLLYPLGGKDPVFCHKCLNEMLLCGDTFICRHCEKDEDLPGYRV
ncbi:hypothetical protein H8E77_31670 [bacterium]|nr:hypothetical protein [bacterium]